tara:strand:+ start:133 stop:381 length:249 start_codon:yes stop_codon:yes gene_type:complete
MPRKTNVMGLYSPTSEEKKAYRWCINNGIFISPFANAEGAWYIDIKLNNNNYRSPEVYGPVTIWIKMYEYYKYYYNKYANKI